MDEDQPLGGCWNLDAGNLNSFGRQDPGVVPSWPRFEPDRLTRSVIETVNPRFKDRPGRLSSFYWPVTLAQALGSLSCFVGERLPNFGRYRDAMWSEEH